MRALSKISFIVAFALAGIFPPLASADFSTPVTVGELQNSGVASGEVANWLVGIQTGTVPFTGDVDLNTSGKTLILEDGTAASTCVGNATANGTTAVVTSTTCVQTGDYVLISRDSAPSGTAQCWADTIVDGTSFNLDCSGAETGTFNWWVLKGQ
jgi:hypothetical protein